MVHVYLICAQIGDNKLYKIGHTKRNIKKRIKELKTGNAADFTIIDFFTSKWGIKIEFILHNQFKSKKINGEWFNLDLNDIKNFKSQCELIDKNLTIISESLYFRCKGKF